MAISGQFAPAFVWRAFFILAAAAGPLLAGPATSVAPGLAQVGRPDAAESRRILEQFRQADIAGEYYLEFELRQLPRRGDERVFNGRLWGGRNSRGTIARISLTDATGRERRILMQNGMQPAVWTYAGGRLTQPGMTALLDPLVSGVELTAFDLKMPFLAWPDVECTAIVRVLGRPAYAFFFRPPADFTAQNPEPAAVRAYFDAQFNAPTQTELLDAAGRVTKTFSLVEIKRIGTHTLPKVLEVRNESTRDKTRFVITAAALDLNFTSALFEPASLADDIRPPSADRLVRISP
jgi:hypothetical protein